MKFFILSFLLISCNPLALQKKKEKIQSAPLTLQTFPTGTLPFNIVSTYIEVSTDLDSTCRSGGSSTLSFDNMSVMEKVSSTKYRKRISIPGPGSYTYYARCKSLEYDREGDLIVISFSVAASEDTTAPILSSLSPIGTLAITSGQTQLSLYTDEKAECRFSPTSGDFFSKPKRMRVTNASFTKHEYTLSMLQEGESYTYYIQCVDLSLNISAESSTTFSIPIPDTTPPTVTLISPTSVLINGISSTDVQLRTNEESTCYGGVTSTTAQMEEFTSIDQGFNHSYTLANLAIGENPFYVYCSDGTNESSPVPVSIVVSDGVGPELSLVSPQNMLAYMDTQEDVVVETDGPANCKGSKINQAYSSMDEMLGQNNNQRHSILVTGLVSGANTYFVQCSDGINFSSKLTVSIFVNDGLGPVITLLAPTPPLPASTEVVQVQVSSNEQASCKGSKISNEYGAMELFTSTNSTNHLHSVQDLQPGDNTYYVQCSDGVNLSNLLSLNLEVTVVSDDPLFADMWSLINTGQKNYAYLGGVPGADLNTTTTIGENITGLNIKVAVSDDGLELGHEDLAENTNLSTSRDYRGDPPWDNKDPVHETPNDGHGTSVAGVIGAVANNGIGVRGVAPGVELSGFRFIGSYDADESISGITNRYLDQANGPFDIFNYSYGIDSCAFSNVALIESVVPQLKFGVENLRSGKGSLYFKAAGNEWIGEGIQCGIGFEDNGDYIEDDDRIIFGYDFFGIRLGYYFGNASLSRMNSSPYIILIGASNAHGVSTSYSSPGTSLWVTAPGGAFGEDQVSLGQTANQTDHGPGIMTTDYSGCNRGYAGTQTTERIPNNAFDKGENEKNSDCNYISAIQGTSFSSPNAAAVGALLLEVNPNLSWRDVKHILASTAKELDPGTGTISHPVPELNLSGHNYANSWVQNAAGLKYHFYYGFGSIDVDAAVAMARTYTSALGTQLSTNFADTSGAINIAIPDANATGASSSISVSTDYIIEAVQIRLSSSHPFISDLGVELTSPSGTVSKILNINSGAIGSFDDNLLLTNAFYGESSAGTWTLKVIDGRQTKTGNLQNWKINIFGHVAQ